MAIILGYNFRSKTFYNEDIVDMFYPTGETGLRSSKSDLINLNAGNGRNVILDEAPYGYTLYSDWRSEFIQLREDNALVSKNFETCIDNIYVSTVM